MRSPLFLARSRGLGGVCQAAALLGVAVGLAGCVVSSKKADGGSDMAELQGPPRDLQIAPNDLLLTSLIVSGVSPERGAFGGGETLTLSGSGFLRDVSVTIGGVAAELVRLRSLSQITFVTPPSPEVLGLVPIEVRNTDGSKATLARFRYVAKDLRFALPMTPHVGAAPAGAALFDFNGDGISDLVVSLSGENLVAVLLSSRGTFASLRFGSTDAKPLGVAAADFDGDGKGDAAVAQNGASSVRVFLGDGTGLLPRDRNVVTSTASQPVALAAADMNGDQRPDLIVVSNGGAKVEVLLNNADQGSVRFENKGGVALPAGGTALAIGDLNGDKRTDVVATSSGGKVTVMLTQADGTLSKGQEFDVGAGPRGVALADLNNDGKLDLLAVTATDGKVTVVRGAGDGTFDVANKAQYVAGQQPSTVAAGDLDGDGAADVVVGNSLSNDISVLHNKGDGSLEAKTLQITGQIVADGGLLEDTTKDVATLPAGKGVAALLVQPLHGSKRVDMLTVNTGDDNVAVTLNRSR